MAAVNVCILASQTLPKLSSAGLQQIMALDGAQLQAFNAGQLRRLPEEETQNLKAAIAKRAGITIKELEAQK